MQIHAMRRWMAISACITGVVIFVVIYAVMPAGASSGDWQDSKYQPEIFQECYKQVNTNACRATNNCGAPPGVTCGDCMSCPYTYEGEPATMAVEASAGQKNRLQFGTSRCWVLLQDCIPDEDEGCGYRCEPWDEPIIACGFTNSVPEGDVCP